MVAINTDESYLPNYNNGVNELQAWRDRYSKSDYPEKILINTFYRQHTVNFMWDFLYSPFERNNIEVGRNSFNNYTSAREKISDVYRQTQLQRTQPALMNLLNKRMNVGGLQYQNMADLVKSAESYNNKAVEELEYSYLYFLLANEYLFKWSACGMIGQNKEEAFTSVTSMVVNTDKLNNYEDSLNTIGQLGAGQFLQRNYSQLNKL